MAEPTSEKVEAVLVDTPVGRHDKALEVLAEIKDAHADFERSQDHFYRLLVDVYENKWYRFLPTPYRTFEAFVLGELGVSKRTGHRWVSQARELLALEPGDNRETAGGTGAHRGTFSDLKPDRTPKVSQREAERRVAARKAAAAPKPPDDEAPKPAQVVPEHVEAEVVEPPAPHLASVTKITRPETVEVPPDPFAAVDAPAPVKNLVIERGPARQRLDSLLGLLEQFDPKELAAVATPTECKLIVMFAAQFTAVAESLPKRAGKRTTAPHPKPGGKK